MDSEIMKILTTFVPLYLMIGMFALCYAIRAAITHPPDYATPDWFIAFVFAVGQVVGGVMFFNSTNAEDMGKLEWWQVLAKPFLLGLGYGGAVVLLWELRKKATWLPEWFFPDKAAAPKP